MRKISVGTIVSNKKVKIIVVLGFFLISLSLSPYFFNEHDNTNHINRSYVDKKDPNSIKDEKIESQLKASNTINWEIEPTLDRIFFSPNSTSGEGDRVFHTFSVDKNANYTLNISKYYDPIENYPGSLLAKEWGAAYLIPDGTWLIVLQDHRFNNDIEKDYFMLGVGNNASDLEWSEIGEFNSTSDIVIAGNETGQIYLAFIENQGLGSQDFFGINYFSTNNWGESWENGTIANYTDYTDPDVHGLSMAEFDGNFTCMWGFENLNQKNASRIWTSSLNTSYEWQEPVIFSSLANQNGINPQIFYNQTKDNGTFYLAYYNNTGEDPEKEDNYLYQCLILKFYNFQSKTISGSWRLTEKLDLGRGDFDKLHCAKDYSENIFYFHQENFLSYNIGIQNATWGQDLKDRKLDLFNAESESYFNLYANNGPKCFSMGVKTAYGDTYPGLLNCEDPFNIVKINKTVNGFISEILEFDGKDKNGIFQKAESYSFDLKVGDNLEKSLFAYVDISPVNYTITKTDNNISPFSSLDFNDEFSIKIEANKPGIMDLNIKSRDLISQTSNITKQTYEVRNPLVCGNGINNFLFFTEKRYDKNYLMFSKSYDGGITWETPDNLASSSHGLFLPRKALMNNTDIYLWTKNGYLFISTNLGDDFISSYFKKPGNELVDVTNDLKCWSGGNTTNDKFFINKSNDLGFAWDKFCNFTLKGPGNYSLQSVAHDPISGNYSFLLTHKTEKLLLFYTISHDGKNISKSNNLLVEGKTPMSNYQNMVNLDVRKTLSGFYEWIVTSSAVNSLDTGTFSSKLSYCVSSDGLTFTDWENFTDIGGNTIDVHFIEYWDIVFHDVREFCLISSKSLGFKIKQISTTTNSKCVYRKSKNLDLNNNGEIEFKGISNSGDILPDGTYDWVLTITDWGGGKYSETGMIILDNTNPALNSEIITNPIDPFPRDNVSITIPIYEFNPDYGYLYYRDPEGEWQEKAMQMDLSSYPYVDFSATIPSHPDNVSTVYWKAVIYDTCGNSLVVDNNGQLYSYSRGIFEYIKQTGKLNPTLYDDWNWTYIFTSGADHLDEVWIHKSLEGNNGIEEEDILLNPIDTFNTTYSIEICHDLEHFSGTYKFMFCSDEGDNYTIEEIQLKKPSIRIEQEEKPLSLLDLSQSTSHNISFKIPEYNEYIDYVSIEYEYDNGEDKRMENMTKIGELYTFSFKNFPKNATQVNYTVIAVDIFGNNITWDQYQSIKLLPALPEWEMSAEVQAIVALSSLIIGIGCAVVYSSTMGSETQNSIEDKLGIKAEKDEKRLKTNERNEQDIGFIIGKLSSISKKGLMIGTLATLYAVATILAVVSIFGLKSSEIAMVLLTGAFLSMVTIWVLLFGHFTEKTFRSNQLKLPISYKIILLGISIIIYVVLFSIFLVGNTIAWWRVRVNELSYNIAGIRIPRALTTVTTAFFSSILLLTWSTLKELSKKTEEFFESMELNENPLKIAERKEKSINSIVNSIGKKGILFVTIIGVVIIFASDLSIYANQGMLIVIPFALGALLTLFIYSIRRKKEEPTIQKRLLDNTVICAQCGEKTALSGTYCEFCGNRLLSGERASKGILCENCKKINIRGGKFCRHCGTELKEQNFEEKQATKEPSKTKNEKSSKPKPKNKDKKKEGKP